MAFTRREFLIKGAAAVAFGLAVPPWLARMARAQGEAGSGGIAANRSLVVVQLTGGNDGLNTVVPYADNAYLANRPNVHVAPSSVLQLDNYRGLNPAMTGMKQLYDNGQMAIVQGVGYPNPTRSHFQSQAIWETADPTQSDQDGWLGRLLNTRSSLNSLSSINIGVTATEALQSSQFIPPTINGLANFGYAFPRSTNGNQLSAVLRTIQETPVSTPYGDFIRNTALATYASADAIEAGIAKYSSTIEYTSSALGSGLQQIAKLIAANLGTQVYYVTYSGFDTHGDQVRRQTPLLSDLSANLASFQQDLGQLGQADNVLTVVYSEFGRRVHENGSAGTDHGTASETFVIGSKVNGGLYGEYPSLTNLVDGDLIYTTDFRSVYSTIIDDWLGASSEQVLGGSFGNLGFV